MDFDNFAHGLATVDGGRMHYRIGGEGPTVVLLHGWPQHSLQWHTVAPLLARQYRVPVPDLPGCGGSELRADGQYDKRTIATALGQLIDQLDLGPLKMVGYDHGSGVAYNYTCQNPDRVTHLAIVEFVLQGCGYENFLVPGPNWSTSSNWQLALFTVPDVAEFAFRGRERDLLTWFFWHSACNPFAIASDHLQQYVDQVAKPGALRAGIEYYGTLWQDIEINKENMKHKLTMPVLGVGGRHNIAENVGARLAPVADNVTAHVIEHAGHWVSDEQPEALARVLAEFFVQPLPAGRSHPV